MHNACEHLSDSGFCNTRDPRLDPEIGRCQGRVIKGRRYRYPTYRAIIIETATIDDVNIKTTGRLL